MARALRELFAEFAVRFDPNRTLERGNRQVDRVRDNLRRTTPLAASFTRVAGMLGVAIGGTAMVAGLSRFIGGIVRTGDEIEKVAQQVGLTMQEFQAFAHAADLSGVDAAAFANSMGQLQRRALDATTGTAEASEAFERLGISMSQLVGADGELVAGSELLRLVADGLQRTTNSSVRTATSMELMGRSGRRMLPMLTGGREGLARLTSELEALGGGMSDVAIRASVELQDSITRLRLSWRSMSSGIAVRVLPAIDWLVRKMTTLGVWFGRVAEQSNLLAVGLGTIGTAAAIAAGLTIATWGPVAGVVLLVAGLVLMLEDLVTTAQGGESVTRDLLVALLGLDGAQPILADIRDTFQGISEWAQRASTGGFTEWLTEVLNLMREVAVTMASLSPVARLFGVTLDEMPRVELPTFGPGAEHRGVTPPTDAERAAAARAAGTAPLPARIARIEQGRAAPSEDLIAPSRRPISVAPAVVAHARPQGSQTVDARMDVSVVVNEATDAREVERRVDVAIRRAQERQARQLQAAQVES